MSCKITYKGKQYNNDTALQLDVLKDRNLLERYSELYSRLVDNAILDLDAVEQFEEAKQQLFNILPDDVFTITNKSTLLDRVLNNGITFGYLDNKIIYLASKAPVGNAYHEAFHAVFRTFLTDNEIQKYLELAREKYGIVSDTELDSFRQQSSTYNKLSKERLEHLWYEEKMANDFSLYMQNKRPKTVLGKLFAKLKQIIDFFFDSSTSLDSLFGNIALGQFRTARPVHNIYRTSKPVFNLITPIGFSPLTSSNINLIENKLYFDYASLNKGVIDTNVEDNYDIISNLLKRKFDLDAWSSQFGNIQNEERKATIVQKIATVYNAISLDNHYVLSGSEYKLEANTPQQREAIKTNLNNIINNTNKRLKEIDIDDELQSEEEDDDAETTTELRDPGRQYKGSYTKFNKATIQFFEATPFYEDIFGIGMPLSKIKELPSNEKELYLSFESGGVIFNTLRKNTTDISKKDILATLLSIDEEKTNSFIDAAVDTIVKELSVERYNNENITASNIKDYVHNVKFLEHLSKVSPTYNIIIQAFSSSKDIYLGVFDKGNESKQVRLDQVDAGMDIAQKWASVASLKKVDVAAFKTAINKIAAIFKGSETLLFDSRFGANVNNTIDSIYTEFRNIGITIPKLMIEVNLISNYIDRLATDNDISTEEAISKAKEYINKFADKKDKTKLNNLLQLYNIRNANKTQEQERKSRDYRLRVRENTPFGYLMNYRFYNPSLNPLSQILNSKERNYLLVALANETLNYSASALNDSILGVDGKSIFTRNPQYFQSELFTTLKSPEFKQFVKYISKSDYTNALNKLQSIFGKNSKYQYNKYLINKLFIAFRNNPLFKKNGISKDYTPEQLIDMIANNIVLYSTGTLDSENNARPTEEYDKLDTADKLSAILKLYSRDISEGIAPEFAEPIRNFVATIYEAKSIHRVITAPIKLGQAALNNAYNNSLKSTLKTEYELIRQEVNNVKTLYNNRTTSAEQVFLYEDYNYVRVNDNAYVPVFSDTGAFVKFVKLDRKYNDIGEFLGVEVVDDDNGGLNEKNIPRAFKLFEFKDMNTASNIETAARSNVEFNTLSYVDKALDSFHKLKFNNFMLKLQDMDVIGISVDLKIEKTC